MNPVPPCQIGGLCESAAEHGEVRQVSVAEIMPRGGDEFERTPPHDIAAEQCVLGGMMLSKDAISDVLDVIKAHDYYRPAHQLVHETILDLYGRGEPADAVTVAAELTKRGDIGRMGGAPYLHTLIASVPTAANAGYYARIVRERAILRRLVEVGTRIVQLGYAGDGDANDLVDRAEAEVYGVTDRRVSEDYLPLSEIMPGALDEIEAIGSPGRSPGGRAHRLLRPGCAHQRPAPRPDDHHRGPAGDRKVRAGSGYLPVGKY